MSYLGKFNPDNFETHETAFISLLAQTMGCKAKILSILCTMLLFLLFVDDAKRHMYQLPLTGKAYNMDNKSVYHLLKSFLINMSGWTWELRENVIVQKIHVLCTLNDLQNASTWKEIGQRTDESKKVVLQVCFATKNQFLMEGSFTLSFICRRDGENHP
jgi:hypothetical protein